METIHEWLDAHKEELTETLTSWLAIPSVKAPAEDGAPFGRPAAQMLDKALADCERFGLTVRDFDHFAGDARMGRLGEDPLAILAHLDVVPAGDGWRTEPFTPTLLDGRIYARGTGDDKGPTVAALYAMRAVLETGVKLKREVRLILGCDEESGWADMEHYTACCDMPRTGFSPDADYPVINTEKGLLHLHVTAPAATDGLRVFSIDAGTRPNVVPGQAVAYAEGDAALCERANVLATEMTLPVHAEMADGRMKLTSTGVNGHAAYPEAARNAIGQLLLMLRALGVTGGLKLLADKVGLSYDGAHLSIKCSDDVSGPLTCNLGILRYTPETGLYATLDIRYPMLVSGDAIIAAVTAALAPMQLVVDESKAPHHVPESSELVQCLLDAYHEETGLPKVALAIGGGTYARCLQEGVAFGSAFPGDEELAHQANEYIALDRLYQNVLIFARAIIKLAAE